MPKLHLKIQMEVAVSNQFLDQFKLEEMGRNYNFFRGSATKPDQFPDEHNGNEVLAGEIANKCFRNNSVTVYHASATELSEGGRYATKPDQFPEDVMKVPEAITYELELCMFGMIEDGEGTGSFGLAETMDEATSYDVELHLRFEQTGQIEILYEQEYHNFYAATEQFNILDKMFGDASHNIEPEH